MLTLRIIKRLLLHGSIILAVCFLAFSVLDWYNPMMGFTTNALSGKLMVVFCIVSILGGVIGLLEPKNKA